MKITIARKIAFSFLVIIILFIGMIGIDYQGFKKVNASLDNMELENVKQGSAENLRFNITQLLMPANDFIITGYQHYKSDFDSLNNIVNKNLYEFQQLPPTKDEKLLVVQIKNDLDSIRSYSEQIFLIPEPRQSLKAAQLMETMDYRFGEEVNRKTTEIFDGISERVVEYHRRAAAEKENVMKLIFSITFIGIILSIVFSFLTVRRISKPIITVAKAADSIANGDYSHRCVVKTHDEIELLAKSFNQMSESIQQSHKALRESKRLTEAIVKTVPIGLLVFDHRGKILSVNISFCNFFGLSQNLLLSKNITTMFEKLNIPEESRNNILAYKTVSNIECNYSDPAKGTRVLNLTFFSIALTEGESLLMLEDITERKRAEQELLRIGTAIEQTADWVVITDRDGIIQYVNPAFTKISGFSKEEALGKTPRILKSGHHPPPLKFYETLWETILRGEVYSTTFTNKRKDGELIYEYETITPIKDKEGNITHFVSTGKEITEQRRAEEEIIFQKNRFAQLFDNSPIAITLLDDQDKIILINESFSNLFGYFFEEIKGKSINDLIVPNELKEEAKQYSEQTHEGNQINKESYRRKKDGTLVYVQLVAVPVIINEKTVGVYKMYVDMTQRKITEEELINAKEKAEEVSRLKSNFLTNMSHELRTPLNGIMGYADILTSQLVEPEQIEMTQGIYDSGMRLSETLNFILDLSKAETDTIEVIAKDVAVVPLAINSINSFSNRAAKRNLQFETIIKEKNIFAHLDGNLFSRILYNLLDNALKFTRKGKISVEIGKELIAEKDWLYIKIKDTGIGIAPNKIDLIWEDFRQVSEGLSRSYEGTGLGLTISKKAVELMQGVISVESELGVGSVFTVKFPAINAIRQKEELITDKQSAVIQSKKETAKTVVLPLVLCVEDDFVNRDIVKIYLKNICILETAEDGETALQLAAGKKYDLILMDINLGTGMNGIEVVKELLKMPKYAGTPIIAVSAYVTGKDKAEFLKGGGTHYLTKPFQKREILDLVKSVLKNN